MCLKCKISNFKLFFLTFLYYSIITCAYYHEIIIYVLIAVIYFRSSSACVCYELQRWFMKQLLPTLKARQLGISGTRFHQCHLLLAIYSYPPCLFSEQGKSITNLTLKFNNHPLFILQYYTKFISLTLFYKDNGKTWLSVLFLRVITFHFFVIQKLREKRTIIGLSMISERLTLLIFTALFMACKLCITKFDPQS